MFSCRVKGQRIVMACGSISFEIAKRDGAARAGVLKHSRGQLQTPALLLYTKRGSPMYLTPDMIHQLGPGGQSYIVDVTKL